MNKIKHLLFLSLIVIFASCNNTIDNPEWVINEVVLENTNGYIDSYGNRSAWIEIFNNTFKSQELGGRYLTDDPENPKKYPIPQGDVLTKIPPRQHVVFFADGEPINGTFHLNFKLDPSKEIYLALYENDGKTLLDEIIIPIGIPVNKSYGYESDGCKFDETGSILAKILPSVTPSTNNKTLEENPKILAISKSDPIGLTLSLTSIFVVFIALIVLYLLFKAIGKIAKMLSERRVAKSGSLSVARGENALTGEVLAAISAAIHELNEDAHDIENTILTISQVKRSYSPWSSKIHTLRKDPRS